MNILLDGRKFYDTRKTKKKHIMLSLCCPQMLYLCIFKLKNTKYGISKSGLYPIIVRVIKNRKTSYFSTGQFINEKDWDKKNHRVKKSHPNFSRLNNFLAKKLSEANDKLLEVESSHKIFTAEGVTKKIKSSKQLTSFFEIAESYISQLVSSGKYSRVSAEKPRIKHFKSFLKGKDITFEEITVELLKQFKISLRITRKISDRTIVNHLVVIRTIFNIGIRQGIVERKYYPFGKGKIIIKYPPSVKKGLSIEELSELEEIDLSDNYSQWHARNVWLFSFYFAGMRISDVLKIKWTDLKDGRLQYRMGKNKKVLSMKIPKKALSIIDLYFKDRSSVNDFLFPELRRANMESEKDIYRKIATSTKKFNTHLSKIAKKIDLTIPLTTHIARHTFGNISGDKIPIQMLQKLYRHSDIQTTINYQSSFILKDADEALDSVLNYN